jgi:hypothetical protein
LRRIEGDVVSKGGADAGAEAVEDVVDVHVEEEGSKDRSLGNSRVEHMPGRAEVGLNDAEATFADEGSEPVPEAASYAELVEAVEKELVPDTVKCLDNVQEDDWEVGFL